MVDPGLAILHSEASGDAILALPPPPSYDVTILTDTLRRWTVKKDQEDTPRDAHDGLIVRNVNATVKRGEVMAIIGGSGSGKTTLLHAMAARLGDLPIAEGHVSILPSVGAQNSAFPRGGEGRFKGMSKVVGFVRQNDYLLPHLTVRETLGYAAKLRLPASLDDATRTLIVEQTLQELGLAEAAETIVGGAGRKGISGGEKRRLSIGCVLVSFPSVLILDEPTTGLDSFTAFQLLETLDRLAKRGRTIILSLHQPRSDAFALFSRILLLSHGSVVYSGETTPCLPYFATLGHQPEKQTNPLDFLIDISSIDTRDEDEEHESRERVAKLVQCWKEKELIDSEREKANPAAEKVERESNPPPKNTISTSGGKRPNIFQQTAILVPRSLKNMIRGYPELIGHLLQAVILGLLMGITFFRLGGQPNDIQSLKTLAFQVIPVYTYMSQVVWTFKWCTSLVVFDREREDGLYDSGAWVVAEFLAWMPMNIFAPFVYAVMVYFICSMRTDDLHYNFGVFVIDIIMVQLCFVAWPLFAASIERSFARASLLGNALSIFFILSPGYFVVNVPGWIRWFRWLSPLFFSFRIIVISQFRNRTFSFMALSWLLLTVWKPGGVRHARRISSDQKGKELSEPEIDLARARVDVRAENVKLFHVRRTVPSWQRMETPILTDVSARFPSGEVSVIMGPSGSGKSTFLRMCAGRPMIGGLLSSFESHGQILFNGVPVSNRTRHVCAFVEQDDDYHLPALTVREALRFAAIIKLPSTISRKRKLARAEEVLRMLGLKECADGMVGGELLKGISGGEKRRLSLACEMINDPAVLIVDEPTSGLDSKTARNVMEALRDIARSGRTVIASLHQPRSDIYNMADNFMILAKQGNVVYQGPRQQLLTHFALAGHICPPLYNPSDFCMDLISVDVRGKANQENSTARVKGLIEYWRNHQDKVAEVTIEDNLEHREWILEDRPEHSPMHIALPVVLERTLRNTWRQPDLFWTRWIQAPILAICFFLFFLRLTKGPAGAQDRIGIVAECTTALAFVGFLNLAALYPMERTVFFHDYKSAGGRYSTATFVIAFSLFAIIPEFISALIFALIMNVATGMQTNPRIFFEFTVAIWVELNMGESIGIAFASFFDTMGLSVSLVSVFLSVAGQCSSVFSASVAKFLADIAWIFPMKYSARVLLINEMQGLQFNCSPESILSGECTAATGQQVLDLFGYHDTPWRLLVVSIAITVGYRIAAWAILALRMRYI
ncbi:hypothetical protein EW026_g7481 [Hermanssonia centrifuga]|uniref:ABC transporter domain-containing protein n=1 Tax=Hermanssonia centrifuga TaxID=98765 RepID=A0A4S4KC57_9APHY|nr:hypothetical protein EW026_g7481 [Hermanssonia centrifuga]